MTLLGRLTQPLRGVLLLRRVLAEVRGLRRATERVADALELAAGSAQPPTGQRQTFRSFSRSKGSVSDKDLQTLTEVSYVDDRQVAELLQREEELRVILKRDPTEEEVERAYRGELG